MRHNRFSTLHSFTLAAALAATSGVPIAAGAELSQVVEMPTFPLLSTLKLDALLTGMQVGCNWIPGADSETKNIGFPDTNAGYFIVSVPVNMGPEVTFKITGRFPKSRYFGFQIYDGYRPGNLIDTLPDARITPDGGPSPAANPAVLPVGGDYSRTYEVTVKYAFPPDDSSLREPNTLYAGKASRKGATSKQIVYRTYLPNPGVNKRGGVPLPSVVYNGPKGEIDLRDTPDVRACANIKRQTENTNIFPIPGTSSGRPQFKAVQAANTLILYPNGDANYLRALPAKRFDDMVVIRAKAPVTPLLPKQGVIATPQTRYWSICQNELNSSSTVACLADREMTLQDGYLYVVISTPEKRPPMARREFGYNWLPFGDQENGIVGFRQILANPNFAGNYAKAVAQPNMPLSVTLGEWAPEITYCDLNTFGTLADVGGPSVFAACKIAHPSSLRGG